MVLGVQRCRVIPALTAYAIGSYLLGQGYLYTRVESRLLPRLPKLVWETRRISQQGIP